ncbi:LysR substrate-binding domain-containing protein [Aestuariicoccus sp. MJ-SS9]|uniref:LysR substrate-binding domain-containing protein n=1 Tax=Aestuariicoccus sp. MJ-SS9 TaxID=3079855 RepID=UPI00290B59F1|nr:LysR substrate-binding domain-containing protein [Aestuariicoccus sp. MJ-SS9]MDU8913165.1 LysR substrate-binding domain-containing protein [Aestuariicoccus sp. MJ-SS9]
MSIKHLRTLVAVAEHRTFSDAADAVCLTHAAVSQQMRALEAELELTLFDRSTRTPTLNATGRALVAKAREVLRGYDNMVPSILDETTLAGEVSLGAVPTTLTGLMPRAMTLLKRTCPALRLSIRPGLTGPLVSALKRDQLDAAVMTKPVVLPENLEFRHIATEPLRLIASAETACDDPLELLATRPFIRFNRDAVVGTQIESWVQERKLRVSETMELDNLDAIASMVHADLGVSIVPQSCVAPAHSLPLKWLDLGPAAPVRHLGLAFKSDTPKARILAEIEQALRDAAGTGGAMPE